MLNLKQLSPSTSNLFQTNQLQFSQSLLPLLFNLHTTFLHQNLQHSLKPNPNPYHKHSLNLKHSLKVHLLEAQRQFHTIQPQQQLLKMMSKKNDRFIIIYNIS